jgi:DNA replication protein DnaC
LILGPVGVGKTHLASGLGHLACRRGHSVLFVRTEGMLKQLRASRLDHSIEREMRRLIAVDLLILDDFGLDTLDALRRSPELIHFCSAEMTHRRIRD